MPGCSAPSAPASLIEIRPSRCLGLWQLALPALLAVSGLMVSGPAGAAAVLAGLWWWRRRGRPGRALLILSAGDRFALPAEGRFDLGLDRRSRAGPGCLELAFSDDPTQRRRLFRDQLDAAAWRRLRLAVEERR